MSTLSQNAIDLLPLSAEPMFQWEKDTDICAFVDALDSSSDYPTLGIERFDEEAQKMREYTRLFTKNLMEDRGVSTYLDFYQDARFGQVAKYGIALICCLRNLLEDTGFSSLAHLLEFRNDMVCSLLLASHFNYRQATLMLGSVL